MNKNILKFPVTGIFILALFLSFNSCRSNDNINQEQTKFGQTRLQINMQGIEEVGNEDNNLETTASINNTSFSTGVQTQSIPFDNNYSLVATLTPASSALKSSAQASLNPRAGIPTPLNSGIMYKVIVYDSSTGAYITEKNYITGQKSESIALDSGIEYTFIVYSINKPGEIPAIKNGENLKTAQLSGIKDDLMFFKRQLTLTPTDTNTLDIVLKHQFSQITTTINASVVGNITEISNVKILPSANSASIQFNDSNNNSPITYTDKTTGNLVNFTSIGATTITSSPTLLIASLTTSGTISIGSITINKITKNNLTYNGIRVKPGERYSLSITLKPTTNGDSYIIYDGQPAARINGQIWMRHNLGADTSVNPDSNPSQKSLHGNYYQWGKKRVVADASTQPNEIPGWETSPIPAGNAWNTSKTSNDPCPRSYRVPTASEFQALLNVTSQSRIGTWDPYDPNGNPNNYSAAVVIKSNSNSNVQLTIPAAGARNGAAGRLNLRGMYAYLWFNNANNGNAYYFASIDGLKVIQYSANPMTGMPVRCIAQ